MLAVAKRDEQTPEQAKAARRDRSRAAMSGRRAAYPEAANESDASLDRLNQARQRESQRVAQILQRDQPPAPPKKGKKGVPAIAHVNPTPEWLARYHNIMDSPTTSSGFKMAARPIYRKHPWFESLCGRDDAFNDEDLAALRYYRNAHESSQQSETKCSLASMVHGSGGGNGEPSLAAARAKSVLARLEPALGSLLITMRAIALEDLTYEQVAMARFGYRQADYFDAASGVFTQRPRPTSGRNPGKIKAEFIAGTKLLTAAMLGRGAANTNSPTGGEIQVAGVPVHQQLSNAIYGRSGQGRPVTSIIIAEPTIRAIARELGLIVPPNEPIGGAICEFEGIPLSVHEDWKWGWVLNGEAE